MAGFTIKLDGDVTEVRKSIAELTQDLKGFKSSLSKSMDAREIVRLNQEIKQAETNIKRLKGLSLGGDLTKSANGATASLTDLSRIANDVPFGLMGIANNISPMIESFGRLKQETGSAKAALSAMGSSLIGPAGLGLAINLVTSALIIYQNGIAGFNKKTKEAKDGTDDFIKSLKSAAQVNAEAAASEEGTTSKIKALASVILDQTASYNERNRALQDLQTINKGYFGDLTLEENKLSLLTSRVNEYLDAIKAQAVVKGFENEIGRVSVEMAKQDVQLKKLATTLQQARNKLAATPESSTSATGEDRISAAFVKAKAAVKDAQKAFEEQRDIVETLAGNYGELNGQIDAAVANSLKFKSTSKSTDKQEDALKKQLEFYEKISAVITDVNKQVEIGEKILDLKVRILMRDSGKQGLSTSDIQSTIQGYQQDFQEVLNKQALALEAKADLKLSPVVKVTIPENLNFFLDNKGHVQTKVNDEVSKAIGVDGKIPVITLHDARIRLLGSKATIAIEQKEKLEENLSTAINDAILNIKVEALSGLGEMLGAAISGGTDGLKQSAKAMLSTIGGIISQLGRYVIVTALKIKALKETIAKWAIANPGLAVAAGIGLVALGALLRNVNFGGAKLAAGGITTGPTVATIGEAGREVVMPLNKLPQIIGSMNNGGNNNYTVGLGIRDRELYAFIQRSQKKFERNL
jgi:hypothetical protein